jgi:hypothetical protein
MRTDHGPGMAGSGRRWRAAAVLAAGVAVGVAMVATPVSGHIGHRVSHVWNAHLKSKTDARYYTKAQANARYARQGAKAADAELLDGLDSTAFLGVGGKAADAEQLDGLDSTAFLGVGAKAEDADTLDGLDSAAFVQGNGRSFVRVADAFPNDPVAVSIPDIGTLTLACPVSQAAVTVVMPNFNESFRQSWASIDGGAAAFARVGFFEGPHTVAQMPGSGVHRTVFALYREDAVAAPRPTFAALVNVWSAAQVGVCRYFVEVEARRPTGP